MTILALDVATKTGWALSEPFRGLPKIKLGTWHLGDPDRDIEERCALLSKNLLLTLNRTAGIDLAIVEKPIAGRGMKTTVEETEGQRFVSRFPAGSPQTDNMLHAFWGTAMGVLNAYQIPTFIVPVKTWRKAVFGNGNIPGDESKRLSKSQLEEWGVDVANQDEAEAGMILVYANNHLTRIRQMVKLKAA